MNRGKIMQRGLLVCLTVCCLLAGYASSRAEEAGWQLLHSEPEYSDFYYNKGMVARTAEGILTIWTKVVYGAEGRAEMLAGREKDNEYQRLAYTLYQYDINCATKQSRIRQIVHYDVKGKKIVEFNLAGKTPWEQIPLGSRLDMVVDEECPQGEEP